MSSRELLIAPIIAGIAVLTPVDLAGQNAEERGYAFGGPTWTREEGVTTDEYRTYLAAPGGTTLGWTVGGGVFVSRWWAIEGELRRTGVMRATEPSRYFLTYAVERRDTTISAGTRFRLPVGPTVTLEPVALFDFVHEESWLGSERHVDGHPEFGGTNPLAPFADRWGPGLTGGLDARIGGARWALMPGIRTRWMDRGDQAISTWPGGRSRWGLEVLIAGRAGF